MRKSVPRSSAGIAPCVTSHSTTAVPFVAMVPECGLKFDRATGGVADVAPTMLKFMGIEKPAEMTGKSFF